MSTVATAAATPVALRDVSLDDKYTLESGRIYLTGVQALVRLLMLQRQRDRAAGLNTAGFVSGYRGSPLGGLDQALWKAKKYLDRADIKFQPGLNEDLAATAVWGTQQVNLFPGAKYDGVFAMWYGKGPGVDRCGDVFKHANSAGTSKHGGVLVLAGDDHAAKSSTLPHQSDHEFSAAMMPVLYPVGVQEILDLGLHGWAMSRYSGCWVGFKASPTRSRARPRCTSIPARVDIIVPDDFPLPPDGVSIRWPDAFLATEARMQDYKIYAALHYARANQLNRIVIDSPEAAPRHHHHRQELPRRAAGARRPRHRRARRAPTSASACYKVGDALAARAGRHAPVRRRPRGHPRRRGEAPDRRVPDEGAAVQLARRRAPARRRQVRREGRMGAPARRLAAAGDGRAHAGDDRARDRAAHRALRPASARRCDKIAQRVAWIDAKEAALAQAARSALARPPYFCSGCPHNTSTNVPEGSRALAGIGCHFMAIWMDREHDDVHAHGRRRRAVDRPGAVHRRRSTSSRTSATARTSTRGSLAIRAAVAAKVNITYKILYNDAVAMTGGQPVDGPLIAADDRAPGAPPKACTHDRRRHRRAATSIPPATSRPTIDDPSTATSSTPCSASCARSPGVHGADLRPDLRGREAPPPQARQVRRSAEARVHQRAGLRRLRRLRRASRTACRCCRWRPSSAASARSTSRRATRTTPASRASARASSRSKAAGCASRRRPTAVDFSGAARAGAAVDRGAVRHPRHRHRRHRRRHDRRAARHGRAPRGQGRVACST